MIRTVLSNFIVFSIVSSSLWAKDVPIVERLGLDMASNEKSVMEFPFKITQMSDPDLIPDKNNYSQEPPTITKGENVLEFNSQGWTGELKTIVWGYDHPIFLGVRFQKGGEVYYKFTDPIGKDANIRDFESNTHEDVIADLVLAAFNEKAPKGYQTKTKKVNGRSGDIAWDLQLEYIGNEYAVQSWKIVNNGKFDVDLYEEMFASQQNKIYGISIEAPRLSPGEATRVFIVKKAS